MKLQSLGLLCVLLAACASGPSPHAADEPPEQVFSSFEEGCADESAVVLLCNGPECGLFLCRELAELVGPVVPYHSRRP